MTVREHLPISLERLAALQARLDGGTPRDALLAEEALTVDVFDRARRGWLARMSAEVAQRSYLLTQRYQEAYLAERPDLQAEVKQGAASWQATPSEDIDGTAMALNLDLGAALPFFDKADAAPPVEEKEAEEEPKPSDAIPEWKDPAKATQFVSALPDIAALPFGDEAPSPVKEVKAEAPPSARTPPAAAPPPSPAPAPPPPAHPPPPADDLDGTAMVSSLNLGEALPFQGRAAAPPPAADAFPPKENVDGTAMVSHLDLARALPFGGAHAPSESDDVDGTVMVGELRLDLDSALPFEGDAAPPPAAADDLPPMPAGDLDGTAFAPSPQTPVSTPFRVPPAPVTLSESQYASFCGERQYAPAAIQAVHHRYGLQDDDQARALDAHWQARRRRDPALAARLDALTQRYLAWLAEQR